jgi:hypothetical protein
MPSNTTIGISLESHRLKALSWGRTTDENVFKMPLSILGFLLFIYFVPEILGAVRQSTSTGLMKLRAIPIVPNVSIVRESIITLYDARPTSSCMGATFN